MSNLPAGNVRLLAVTEKQFSEMTLIIGGKTKQEEIVSDNKLVVIWNFLYNILTKNVLTILDEVGEIVKRNSYHYIDISSFKDLLEQMEYKKGTLAHAYLRKIANQVDIVTHLEKINEQVELIERAMNQHINLNCGQVEYHLENLPLTLDQLLTKNFSPFFAIENKNLSFEWVSNIDKLSLFLEMLDHLLSQTTEKYLIVLKNIDGFISEESYTIFYRQICHLVKKYPNLTFILFPSDQGYLKIDEENSRFVNILSDQVEHLYDVEFMYERVMKYYPSNDFPTREGFRMSLETVTPYLLTVIVFVLSRFK